MLGTPSSQICSIDICGYGCVPRRAGSSLRLAAQAVQSLGKVQNAKVQWTADVDLFDAALEAITGTLRVFRPHALIATGLTTGSPIFGTPTVGIIREAQAADPARPLNKSTKRQRAMTRLKEDLGEELTERAVRFADADDGTTETSLTTGSPIFGTPTLRINREAQAADPARPDGTTETLCQKEPVANRNDSEGE
jgi:hypothetical protein